MKVSLLIKDTNGDLKPSRVLVEEKSLELGDYRVLNGLVGEVRTVAQLKELLHQNTIKDTDDAPKVLTFDISHNHQLVLKTDQAINLIFEELLGNYPDETILRFD